MKASLWTKAHNRTVPGVLHRTGLFIALALSLMLFPRSVLSRGANPDSLLVFRFLKTDVELAEPGSYFNVLEIMNNQRDTVSGAIRIDCPQNWLFIGPAVDTVRLAPGATKLIPVRISVPGNTAGGISFVIGAEFFGEHLYSYANSYISITRKSRWDMRLSTTELYLSDFMPQGEVLVSIQNTGNSSELVKLSLDLGGLLEFRDAIEADSFLYVDVPAYKDTSIRLTVQRRKGLSYAESKALQTSWKSRNLTINASTPGHLVSESVRANTLESSIVNRLPILNSPLNAELMVYNLLSQQRKKLSARVFGRIFFPKEQQLSYSLGYYNLFFDPDMNREIDLYQQLRYMIRYSDRSSEVWIGDRLGIGTLHTLTGRGIRASHQINDRNRIMLNVVQHPYARNIGGYAGYGGIIGDVAWNTGITLETTTDQRFSHYTFNLGGSYRLMQKHSISLQTATSVSQYGNSVYLQNDTTVAGFAYQLLYRYSGSRLRLSFDNTNTLFNYLRNSGINRINFSGIYKTRGNLQLKARYYRSNYTSTRYPYNFVYPANTNINEDGRLLFSYHANRVIYNGGPRYAGTVRNTYVPAGDYRTRFVNYQPGIIGSVTFRLGARRSLTPNATFNMLYYNFDRVAEGEDFSGLDHRWAYTLGINYYDQALKLNVYYTSGEATDIYRTAVIEHDPVVNQAFHIRPYYERYFLKEALRMSAYLSYSYYMPSLRENVLLNVTGDINVGHTWNFFASFNVYRVSRKDVETGRMTSRDINLILGIRKAFDIQQPRLGYYDLTLVGFNDLNGDGVKSEDEKPISNVLVHLSRDPYKNVENRTGFAETGMITDPRGEIYYENIPMGVYDLSIIPLSNLENLYFLNGEHQTIEINDDLIYYLPLVESYKIRGKIMIDRDPNSTEGMISPEGIRVTAVSESGETYSALTTRFGTYVLDLPKASYYEVSIYNVFGENFRLERGSYRVQFTENKIINLDFKFTEQRRGVRYNGNEPYFQFNLENGQE